MPYLKAVTHKLINVSFNVSSASNVVYKAILTAIMGLAGIKIYLVSVFGLVIIDVITGVMASIKKGESFRSKILRHGLIDKTFMYIIMLTTVFILEQLTKSIFTYSPYYFMFIVSFMIACYETVSIFENLLVLSPNLTFIQPLITLTNSLSDKAKNTAEGTIESVDPHEILKKVEPIAEAELKENQDKE